MSLGGDNKLLSTFVFRKIVQYMCTCKSCMNLYFNFLDWSWSSSVLFAVLSSQFLSMAVYKLTARIHFLWSIAKAGNTSFLSLSCIHSFCIPLALRT